MPSKVDQRLFKTTSQALPTVQPATSLPCQAVKVRYVVSPMPIKARIKSGQFGPLRNKACLSVLALAFLFLAGFAM